MTDSIANVVDLFGHTADDKLPGGAMCQRFIEPPFSTLDARSGRWQARKREWIALGIEGEIGRNRNLQNFSYQCMEMAGGYFEEDGEMRRTGGTSVFDPVLCELMYSWFMPAKTSFGILDPFAGGSVRGIVAARLGYQYSGIELRREQVEANVKQSLEIPCAPRPHWICGDSVKIEQLVGDEYDFLFTCPPYWNLERYSDLSADISTLDNWLEFCNRYQAILSASARRLKSQRFAVVVVGNIREKDGKIRDMRISTMNAMQDAGFVLYNDMILMPVVGTLALRINGQFQKGRKVGAAHQYVMCFFKGNPESIRCEFPEFE